MSWKPCNGVRRREANPVPEKFAGAKRIVEALAGRCFGAVIEGLFCEHSFWRIALWASALRQHVIGVHATLARPIFLP